MLSSAKKGTSTTEITAIWNALRANNYLLAAQLYEALPCEYQKLLDAKLSLITRLKAQNCIDAALSLIEALSEDERKSISTIKIHASIYVDLKQYPTALAIYANAANHYDVTILLGQIKCYYKLKNIGEGKKCVQKIREADKLKHEIAVKLAYLELLVDNPIDAEKLITGIPLYYNNLTLVNTLINIYSQSQQFAKGNALHDNLNGAIRKKTSYLISYATFLLRYKGDPRTSSLYREKSSNILDNLLQTLPINHSQYRNIVFLIVKYKLQNNQNREYLQSYIKLNPREIRISLLMDPSKPLSHLDYQALLQNPNENKVAISDMIDHSLSQGDDETALTLFKALISQDPDKTDYRMWNHYASVLFSAHQPSEAISLFQELIDSHPKYPVHYKSLAHCYRQTHRFVEEEQLLRKAMFHCPNDASILLDLASSLENQEQYHPQIALLQSFIEHNPNNNQVKIQLGYAFIKIGKYQHALTLFDELIHESSDIPEIILGRSIALEHSSDFTQARQFFDQYSNHPLYWKLLAKSHAYCLEFQGLFEESISILKEKWHKENHSSGAYQDLKRCYLKAIKQGYALSISLPLEQPTDIKSHSPKANKSLYKNEVIFALKSPYSQKAKEALNLFEKFFPNTRDSYILKAEYYLKIKKIAKANYYLDKIKTEFGGLLPTENHVQVNLYIANSQASIAITLIEELLSEDPQNTSLLMKLSYCYYDLLAARQATNICFAILKLNPRHLSATLLLARITGDAKDYIKAFAYLKEAAKISPGNLKVALQHAALLSSTERHQEALAILLRCYNDHAEDQKLLLEIFQLYYITNDLESSKIYLDAVNSLYPEDPQVVLATIRYQLATDRQKDTEEINEEINEKFSTLMTAHPYNEQVFLAHAQFIKRRFSNDKAIEVFKKYLKRELHFCQRAYQELGALYLNIDDIPRSQQTYLDGLKLFPHSTLLAGNYFYLLLFIKYPRTLKQREIIRFYNRAYEEFKNNPFALCILDQYMFRANLKGAIRNVQDQQEIQLCEEIAKLDLQNHDKMHTLLKPALEILHKIHDKGYCGYIVGGAARLFQAQDLSHSMPPLHDVDIITNAPSEIMLNLCPQASQNYYHPNMINVMAENKLMIEINCIGPRINDLSQYFYSNNALNIDCLLIDNDGKLHDPTNTAIAGMRNRTLDFVGNLNSTCQQNPALLFKIIRHITDYQCTVSDNIKTSGAMVWMAQNLRTVHSEGKITAEIKKLLLRGKSFESFQSLIDYGVLFYINPTLNHWLTSNLFFHEWFFSQLKDTDALVNSHTSYGFASTSHVMAVYLLVYALERNLHQDNPSINEDFLDDLFCQIFGDRRDRSQMQTYLQRFYHQYLAAFALRKEEIEEKECGNDVEEQPQEEQNEEETQTTTADPSMEFPNTVLPPILVEQTSASNVYHIAEYLYSLLPPVNSFLPGWLSYAKPVTPIPPPSHQHASTSHRKKRKKGHRK